MPTKFIIREAGSRANDIEVTTNTPEIFGAFVQARINTGDFGRDISHNREFTQAFRIACIDACGAGLGDYSPLPGSGFRGVANT